ncbi:MAG: BamA/OMP85 family outer membrane protein [Halanaerobiaceae bacterium]
MKKYFILTFVLILMFVAFNVVSFAEEEAGIQIISAIALDGNDNVGDDEILSVIETKVGKLLDEEKLKSDLEAIYDLGYFQDVGVNFEPYQGGLKAIYEIVEFPVIEEIIIEGNESYSDQEIIELLGVESGQVLNQKDLADGRMAVEEMYHENGYVAASFVDIDLRDESVLFLEINEGYINEIILEGNDKTEDYVVMRELDFSEGDVLNTEKMQRSFQKIVHLNLFEDFNPQIKPLENDSNKFDVVINLSEAKTGNLGAGITWSSSKGWLGFINIQERNLLGKGQTIGFNWEFGGVTNYSINFHEPWLFDTPTSFGISLYDTTEKRKRDSLEYKEHIRGGYLSLGHSLIDEWKGRIRYKLENSTEDKKDDDGNLLEPESASVRSLTLQVNRDTTDHPFHPTSGAIDTFSVEYAGQVLGGDSDFTKYNFDMRRFYSGFRDEHAWALRAKAGFSDGELPGVEKYQLGGSESLRGFENGEFHGSEMLLLNAEYRIPIADKFTGVIFTDAGNAWEGSESIDLSDLRYSLGAGLRMNTPIGQIRLDYGFNDEGIGQPQFSIGQAF